MGKYNRADAACGDSIKVPTEKGTFVGGLLSTDMKSGYCKDLGLIGNVKQFYA
ncbi:hypothetical protein LJR153_003393 [Paenibacillus sp. LjRoot153]|uniref:hypothetical protein n=1 Tax=Paenibacillus sp. LjRoot153 TaxID=3342270 RepID=UPI003ECC453B